MSEVLCSELGPLGILTLNRPHALNSLTHNMIHLISKQLACWAQTDAIKAVVINAVPGRAFCAGGDIRQAYEKAIVGDPSGVDFFADEYAMNRQIFHYPKPYIAILDGITMGGGVGISIHGSHRVATENTVFAMPETGIGFYPDVGGTYFLPRLPGRSGYYLGLTGARIKAADCLGLGLATHTLPSADIAQLLNDLAKCDFAEDANVAVSKVLGNAHTAITDAQLPQHAKEIDRCFNNENVENILSALAETETPFSQETYQTLLKKSPTSLKVTLRALELGKTLDFNSAMQHEFQLTKRFLAGHDFIEGIRALLIDKDQKPLWRPDNLAAVKLQEVEEYVK